MYNADAERGHDQFDDRSSRSAWECLSGRSASSVLNASDYMPYVRLICVGKKLSIRSVYT